MRFGLGRPVRTRTSRQHSNLEWPDAKPDPMFSFAKLGLFKTKSGSAFCRFMPGTFRSKNDLPGQAECGQKPVDSPKALAVKLETLRKHPTYSSP